MVEDPYEDTLLAEFQTQTGRVSLESINLPLKLDNSRMRGLDGRRIRAVLAGLFGNTTSTV